MGFRYHQTILFDNGGYIRLEAQADDTHPLSLDDLQFVLDLAERGARFEHQRHIEREARQDRWRREMPLCWPGFRPRFQ